VGKNVRLGNSVHLHTAGKGAVIRIGNGVYIGDRAQIGAAKSIEIGDKTIIAGDSIIWDSDWHGIDGHAVAEQQVKIGRHVWVCAHAFILKGVSIGDNSIIAAASVVTTDVPANTLSAGNPAKPIRRTRGYTI
jgi:acetyltransferase-like isoleucine patch superfamily enzyme